MTLSDKFLSSSDDPHSYSVLLSRNEQIKRIHNDILVIYRNAAKYIIWDTGDRIDLRFHPKPSDLGYPRFVPILIGSNWDPKMNPNFVPLVEPMCSIDSNFVPNQKPLASK